MATNKRVFTFRLSDEVFDKIGVLAPNEHRSMTLCCCPLSVHQQNKPKLSTVKMNGRCPPLTVPAYFAI